MEVFPMKKLLAFVVVGTGVLFALPASAEQVGPGEYTIPVVTIHGRVDKPHVVIELHHAPAARQAGAAHEELRKRLLEKSAPKPMR
jgi:hypothetical protein